MKKDNFEAGGIYHIFNRGNNRENIFKEERNYDYFLILLKKHILPIAQIYCFCLIKDRFHLIVRIFQENEIPDKYRHNIHLPFSNLFNSYSKSINKAYSRSGSLFQEHFYKSKFSCEEELRQHISWIHKSPLRRRSSLNSFMQNETTFVAREAVIALYQDFINFKEYHKDLEKKFSDFCTQMERFNE